MLTRELSSWRAAMVAKCSITARVLGDLHVLATRTAKIIMGAAVFDDILGMVLHTLNIVVPTEALAGSLTEHWPDGLTMIAP